ncbi:MAG TPA: GNAT family N-acetyltransferase [Clostridium sp.]|nr:GNAT family N-acetyltransferase [Clostridium sp.]
MEKCQRGIFMYKGEITIKETTERDLENVMNLWNNGEVMFFVGFPDGLGITLDQLKGWLKGAIKKPERCHYSIYAEGIGYCGETFYDVDVKHDLASMDIKLLPHAQGKGIAAKALSFAIDKAFTEGKVNQVYVEPQSANRKAWALYEKLGFVSKERPTYLEEDDTYLELTKYEWYKI